MADDPEGKDFYLKTAVDVAVDLRSWLAEKGYKNLSIMTAAVRGPWHIQNSFAPVGGAPVLITTVTGKINQFDAEPTPFDSLMDQPVEEKYLEVLKTSDVFNKAICTPDEGLLTWENLYEYPPVCSILHTVCRSISGN